MQKDQEPAEEPGRYSSARNQSRILHALRAEPGMSKIALTRQLGLSSGTVSVLTAELMERGFVVAGEFEASTGGRPAQQLSLNPTSPLMLGVAIRGGLVAMGIVNMRGELIANEAHPPVIKEGQAELVALLDGIRDIATMYGVSGVGVAMHSLLDRETGTVLHAAGLGWYDLPLVETIERELGLPAALGRTGEAALMAEDWWGSVPSGDPFAFVTAGPNVVVTTKVHGRLVRGASNQAGIFAHTIVDPHGPLCDICGQPGCLSAVASSSRVVTHYHELHEQAGTATATTADRRSIGAVIAVAGEDVLARQALEEAALQLGRGLVILVNLINPRVIVLSGELMDAESIVLPVVLKVVRDDALAGRAVDIVGSSYGGDAAVVGAATLVFERLFTDPTQDWKPAAPPHRKGKRHLAHQK